MSAANSKKKQDSKKKLDPPVPSPPIQKIVQNIDHIHPEDDQIKSFFNVNQQQLHSYFDQKIHSASKKNLQTQHSAVVACNYVQDINSKLQGQFSNGYVKLNTQQIGKTEIKDLLLLIQQKQKISKEQQKANQLKMKREMIQNQLKVLDMQIGFNHAHRNFIQGNNKLQSKNQSQINNLNVNLQLFAPNLLSKQQHHNITQKFIKQRREAAIKRKKYQFQLEKKAKDDQQLEKKKEEQQLQKQKQQRRKKIEQKLKQNEQQHNKKLVEEEVNRKKLLEIKNKKFLYQEIQEKYQSQVIIPQLEQKKKKLKELRQFNHGFDIDVIKNHQKQYLRKRQMSLQNHSRAEQNLNWNYKPPEKSQRLAKLLQDQKIQARRKLQQKKRSLDQRINKQESYVLQLKQKFVPKISLKKRQQIQNRLKKKQKSNNSNQDNTKILGINYLQQAKRKAKKSSQRPNTNAQRQESLIQNSRMILQKRSLTNYLVSDKNKQEYQQIRRKRLQRISKQDGDVYQKIKLLKLEADKVTEQAKRKEHLLKHAKNQEVQQEAIGLLLTSIKAKMGIIDVYKHSSM